MSRNFTLSRRFETFWCKKTKSGVLCMTLKEIGKMLNLLGGGGYYPLLLLPPLYASGDEVETHHLNFPWKSLKIKKNYIYFLIREHFTNVRLIETHLLVFTGFIKSQTTSSPRGSGCGWCPPAPGRRRLRCNKCWPVTNMLIKKWNNVSNVFSNSKLPK